MTNLSRRSLVTSAAALPALAVPAAAVSTGADPVFAAIETHRTAWREYGNKCYLDDIDTSEAKAELELAAEAEEDALSALTEIKPVTRQGAAELLRYIADLQADGETREYYFEAGRSAPLSYFVQRNVAEAMRHLA
jgi:hypothetical protein